MEVPSPRGVADSPQQTITRQRDPLAMHFFYLLLLPRYLSGSFRTSNGFLLWDRCCIREVVVDGQAAMCLLIAPISGCI